MAKVTGVKAAITFNGNTIFFTSITPKANRELSDSTDSGNLDPTSGLVFRSQIPVAASIDIDFEGFYYTDTTDAAFVAELFSSTPPRACQINITDSVIWGHGNVDAASLDTMIVLKDVTKIRGSLMSNGTWTHGA